MGNEERGGAFIYFRLGLGVELRRDAGQKEKKDGMGW